MSVPFTSRRNGWHSSGGASATIVFFAIVLGIFSSIALRADDIDAVWLEWGVGNWSDGTQWSTNPAFPNNGGGATYDATLSDGYVTLDQDVTIQSFTMSSYNGTLAGGSNLTLQGGLTWTDGFIALDAGATITLAAGSTSTIAQPPVGTFGGPIMTGGTISNAGTVNEQDQAGINIGQNASGLVINNLAGATWNVQNGGGPNSGPLTFNNSGVYTVSSSGGLEISNPDHNISATFNNTGAVSVLPSSFSNVVATVTFSGGGVSSGSISVAARTSLAFSYYTLSDGATITGAGSTTITGWLAVTGNASIGTSLSNQGSLAVQSGATLTLGGSFSQQNSDASTQLSGGTITSSQALSFQAGALSGSGTINADLTLQSSAILMMRIGGLSQGTQYDYLDVNGITSLGGTLTLQMLNGFESQLNSSQTFTLLTSDSALNGAFSNIANGSRLETSDGDASFIVNYGPDSPYGADNLVLSDPIGVPEPSAIVLMSLGSLVAFAWVGRRLVNG